MALATWWRGDDLPRLPEIDELSIEVSSDVERIARVTSLAVEEVAARLAAGHRIYVASLDGTPTSYGWVATLAASIGELALEFALPASDRYLWDFVTLPEWRGRGIYPRLLQGIIERESTAERFWIINAPENAASGAGIARAGFAPVGDLAFLRDRGVGSVAIASADRARVGAALLGVTFFAAIQSGRVVSPCWRCVIEQHARGADGAACWPRHDGGRAHVCTCVTVPAAARQSGDAGPEASSLDLTAPRSFLCAG
jgi:GNAT superfamily N-acetyltransferase